MDNKEHNKERVKKYLAGTLTDKERDAFEAEIESNEALIEMVAGEDHLAKALYLEEKVRLEETVKGWLRDEKKIETDAVNNLKENAAADIKPTGKEAKVKGINQWMKIAAGLLILVLASFAAYKMMSTTNVSVLTAQHLSEKHADPVVLRSQSDDGYWEEAVDNYKSGEYKKMINVMRPHIAPDDENTERIFYFALAQMYQKPPQYDSTFYYFSKVIDNDPRTYQSAVNWYSALMYLEKGNKEKAQQLLTGLTQTNHLYTTKAFDLLERLEN